MAGARSSTTHESLGGRAWANRIGTNVAGPRAKLNSTVPTEADFRYSGKPALGAARLLSGRREAYAAFGGVQGVTALSEDELGDQQNGSVGGPDVGDVDRGAI